MVAAIGALGIEPGDEVIVTPWTMSASATAILHWNAIPVFADIDPLTYNLCPASIEENITPYTKAIMVADIFGLSADMDAINAIARKHDLKLYPIRHRRPALNTMIVLLAPALTLGGSV